MTSKRSRRNVTGLDVQSGCIVDSCGGKIVARGYCNRHYLRLRKHGDPLGGGPSPAVRKVVDLNDGSRVCTSCGEAQVIEMFDIDKNGSGGRRGQCKPCRSGRMKQWYADNRERQSGRQADRRVNDVERVREIDRARYSRNREARIELAKEIGHRRRVRLRDVESDRGITVSSLRKIHGDVCPYCGVSMTFETGRHGVYVQDRATIEHIKPISAYGNHTFENTMLCCWQCNIRRGDLPMEVWLERVGLVAEQRVS